MTRVLLADDIVSAAGLVEALKASDSDIDVCGVARTPQGLFAEVRSLEPDVLVVREKFAGVDAFSLAEEIPDICARTRVVIIAAADTPDGRTRAQRSGIAEFVTGEIDGDTLAAAITAALRAPAPAGPTPETHRGDDVDAGTASPGTNAPAPWGVVERVVPSGPNWVHVGADDDDDGAEPAALRSSGEDAGEADSARPPAARAGGAVANPADNPEPPGVLTAPAPGTAQSDEVPALGAPPELDPIQPVVQRRPIRRAGRKLAETFIVFAGKGGVGKSTVATNLACALAMDGAKVVIVDLDLQFGDVGVMLGVEHSRTIEELAQVGEGVDMEYLDDILGTGPNDVRVLLAPSSPELADLVTTATLRAILRELARNFDYVIVDAAAHLEERTLEVIEMADHIVVVTAFNVTSVKDTKIMLKLLLSLGIAKEKIAVLLNQTRQKTNFTREEVEESLRFRIVSQLPFEPRVVDEAIDLGRPFVLYEPKADISRQFRALVDYLAPPDPPVDDGQPAKEKGPPGSKPGRRRFSLGRG